MSKYLRSRSMPTNCKPILAQATPVVPLPMNGSQTVRASGAKLRHHSISGTGFCVGCSLASAATKPPFAQCLNICALPVKLVHAISHSERFFWFGLTLSQQSGFFVGGISK